MLETAVRTHCVTPHRIVPIARTKKEKAKPTVWEAVALDDATLALPNTLADNFDACSFRVLLFRIACWMKPGTLPDFMRQDVIF